MELFLDCSVGHLPLGGIMALLLKCASHRKLMMHVLGPVEDIKGHLTYFVLEMSGHFCLVS